MRSGRHITALGRGTQRDNDNAAPQPLQPFIEALVTRIAAVGFVGLLKLADIAKLPADAMVKLKLGHAAHLPNTGKLMTQFNAVRADHSHLGAANA